MILLMDQVPAGQIVATGDVTGYLDEQSRGRFRLCEPESAGADADKQLCQDRLALEQAVLDRLSVGRRLQERFQ